MGAWFATTAQILFTPKAFFRRLSTTGRPHRTAWFGFVYRAVAAMMLGVAVAGHLEFQRFGKLELLGAKIELFPLLSVLSMVSLFVVIQALSVVVAGLTAWEAAYRGLRLPKPVVTRALHFHAVHLVPPALVGMLTVLAYAWLARHDPMTAADWIMPYTYVLSGEVIVSSVYLFITYWAAMRSLLYANSPDARPSVLPAGAATRVSVEVTPL